MQVEALFANMRAERIRVQQTSRRFCNWRPQPPDFLSIAGRFTVTKSKCRGQSLNLAALRMRFLVSKTGF
jgi:hypothetical protein